MHRCEPSSSSVMIETSEQLAQYVRQNLVPSSAITGLKIHELHGFLSFRWYERDFVVKKSLEVFEVKGQNLLVTGASMLMNSVLKKAENDAKTIDALVGSIRQAEDLIGDEEQRNSGYNLLTSVKATLLKLANAKPASHLAVPNGASRSNWQKTGNDAKPSEREPAPAMELKSR